MKKLPQGYWLPNGLAKHTLPRPEGLIECDDVLDIGAGVRPMPWFKPKNHVCVEPYLPYCEKLDAAGYLFCLSTAKEYLTECPPVEQIFLLDVIEHMHKNEGLEVIELMLEKATQQIVIYTPKGFMQQDEDNWGLGGDHWQKHRSGWLPGEFPDWRCSWYAKGFFAIKNL